MEVGLEALLLSSALLLGIMAFKRKEISPWTYALFSLGVLLRMDAAAPALAAAVAFAWIDEKRRGQHLAWGLGAVVAVLGGLTLFRIIYYGDWLPNTYYLKLGGGSLILRVSIGMRRLWDFVWASNWVLFAIPIALPALDKRKVLLPLVAVLLGQVAYSIYVGGDAWEHIGGANRFIASIMPVFFLLFAHTLGCLQELILSRREKKPGWVHPATAVFIITFSLFSLFSFNTLLINDSIAKWTLIEKPVFTESVERYASMGLTLQYVTTEKATIAVVTAGNIPYFSERTSIDLLGKNDPIIARGPAHLNSSLFEPGNYRPGHNKWNYAYSIGELTPDVVAQIWEGTDAEAAVYLTNYNLVVIDGIPYYFLKDSPNIRWELIPLQQD